METWEAVGELLKERRRTSKRLAVALDPEELNKALFAAGVPEFHKAIMAYLRGDQTKIADYLCMHPLSRGEQAELAWALNDRARPPRRDGPRALGSLSGPRTLILQCCSSRYGKKLTRPAALTTAATEKR